MTARACPFCSGLGVTDKGAICQRCKGSRVYDTKSAPVQHLVDAAQKGDETTLEGTSSEVDIQLPQEVRDDIDEHERREMERIRWEAKREGMVLGCLSLVGVVIVATAIVALVYLFAKGLK